MTYDEALKIVIDLAKDSMLDIRDCEDDDMLAEHKRQCEAIEIIEKTID